MGEAKQVFGAPIERIALEKEVPVVLLEIATKFLANGGENIEGIFRIPGNNTVIDEQKQRINRGQDVSSTDPHVLASLLKLWFRELPGKLVGKEHGVQCIAVANVPREERGKAALQALEQVPEPRRNTLKFLINVLQKVERNKQQTKMDANNLAIVFAHSLVAVEEKTLPPAPDVTGSSADVGLMMMRQLTQDSEQREKFIIALIENLAPDSHVPASSQSGAFRSLLTMFGCVSSRKS